MINRGKIFELFLPLLKHMTDVEFTKKRTCSWGSKDKTSTVDGTKRTSMNDQYWLG